jgi:hypothetical protein
LKVYLNETHGITEEMWGKMAKQLDDMAKQLDDMAKQLDDIEKLAGPNNSRAARAARIDKLGLDAPRVTPDEALELCAHHLKLATMYFEAVPKLMPEVIEEFRRLIKSDVDGHISPCERAGMEWFKNIDMAYELTKDDE